jgi:hypothetical protein
MLDECRRKLTSGWVFMAPQALERISRSRAVRPPTLLEPASFLPEDDIVVLEFAN